MKNPIDKRRWPLAALAVFVLCVLAAPASVLAEDGPAGAEKTAPWKARAELSYVNASGNTESQTFAGKFSLKKEGPVNRYFATASYLFAENDANETANKLAVDGRYERVLARRLFGLFEAGYRRNKFSGYEWRGFGGPGAGYRFVETERQTLDGVLSVLYYHDELASGVESTDDYAVAKATGKYEFRVNDRVKLSEVLDFWTSLANTDKFFVDSVTAAEIKVNGHISVGFSYTVNYQNRLPSPELRHTDKTLLTTVIIDY